MRGEPVSVVLKEDACGWAGGRDGGLHDGDHGLYAHDARWLRRFAWRWPDDLIELRFDGRGPTRLRQRIARIEGTDVLGQRSPRDVLAVHRELTVHGGGVDETIAFRTGPDAAASLSARLDLEVRVEDVFEVRGFAEVGPRCRVVRQPEAGRLEVATTAPDGVIDRVAIDVEADEGIEFELSEDGLAVEVSLPASRYCTLRIRVAIDRSVPGGEAGTGGDGPWRTSPAARLVDVGSEPGSDPRPPSGVPTIPNPHAWRERVVPVECRGVLEPDLDAVALAAADDLRALLLSTAYGPVPAAGVPWYVAPFGRDALLTCLLVPEASEMSRATLRFLAARRGRRWDPSRAEAPGKMPHEMRVGAATRTGVAPFGPHYGTVDATPLWIVALADRVRRGDASLLDELAPAVRDAVGWLGHASGPGDALLRFTAGEGGYEVQSWKDAGDSMSYRDGRLAAGRLAVVEVQGYAEAAWRAAAELLTDLGDANGADEARAQAERLRDALAERFFRPDLGPSGCHALALDEDGCALDVVSSDPGHLLWTGSVTPDHASAVGDALLASPSWSGWGVRTLAQNERRYAAVSYHCGSVWPHDTALFALGLERYGQHERARTVARAVLDLAAARPDRRAPELIAGDARDDGPPVAYPDACRLQAWSAAAVVAMHALLVRCSPDAGSYSRR